MGAASSKGWSCRKRSAARRGLRWKRKTLWREKWRRKKLWIHPGRLQSSWRGLSAAFAAASCKSQAVGSAQNPGEETQDRNFSRISLDPWKSQHHLKEVSWKEIDPRNSLWFFFPAQPGGSSSCLCNGTKSWRGAWAWNPGMLWLGRDFFLLLNLGEGAVRSLLRNPADYPIPASAAKSEKSS